MGLINHNEFLTELFPPDKCFHIFLSLTEGLTAAMSPSNASIVHVADVRKYSRRYGIITYVQWSRFIKHNYMMIIVIAQFNIIWYGVIVFIIRLRTSLEVIWKVDAFINQ